MYDVLLIRVVDSLKLANLFGAYYSIFCTVFGFLQIFATDS